MITGVELAGLMLAMLPIVAKATRSYSEGIGIIRDWRKCSEVYKQFAQKVEVETLLLSQHLENLILQVAMSPSQGRRLCYNLKDPDWSDEQLEVRLREMLPQKAYEHYIA